MKFNSCFSKCFSLPSETAIIDIRKEEPEPGNDQNFTVFSYSELKVATHGFSASNKIGEGAFGSVYKVAVLRELKGSWFTITWKIIAWRRYY